MHQQSRWGGFISVSRILKKYQYFWCILQILSYSSNLSEYILKYYLIRISILGTYSCVCNVGYELYNGNGTAGFFIEAAESGERDGDVYQRNKTCVPVMCPSLERPENGVILSTKVARSLSTLSQIKSTVGFWNFRELTIIYIFYSDRINIILETSSISNAISDT